MKAVILAAGRGSRLAPYSDILPKPLMPVETKKDGSFVTIIDKMIEQIKLAGVIEFVVVVNYKASLIIEHLKDGSQIGVKIAYVFQSELDGNAGAFYRAQHLVKGDDVIVTDSDNFISNDNVFKSMADLHKAKKASLTVGVCTVENVKKFAIIKTDSNGNALDIFEKPDDASYWGHLAKSGMMILSNDLAQLPRDISVTEKGEYTTTQIVKHCIVNKLPIELHSIDGGFYDIGTWAEYIPVLKAHM